MTAVMKSMQGGDTVGDSYAHNSWFQNYTFHSAAKPRLLQAIHHLTSTTLPGRAASAPDATNGSLPDPEAATRTSGAHALPARDRIAIADLGCSHGRNTLDYAHVVLNALLNSCGYSAAGLKESVDAAAVDHKMEIQYFFSDLPANDFNSLFRSLEANLQEALPTICADNQGQHTRPKIFTAGVPGSFYGRLFPSASLDLVICSYALHWLSQVPPSLLDRTSPAWNGGNIWMSKANLKEAVAKAYAEQSQIDLRKYLKNRVQEVKSGGILFLLLFVESSGGHLSIEESLQLCNAAWQEMANEGVITVEELEMFNLPMHMAGQHDIERALKDVPEFRLLNAETVHNMPFTQEKGVKAAELFVPFISSIIKPSLEAYIGIPKASEFFKKLRTIVFQRVECFDFGITHDVAIVSLERL